MFLKIEIELNEERPEHERWALSIRTNPSDEGFPAYLSTHRFVADALEHAKGWVASTIYL